VDGVPLTGASATPSSSGLRLSGATDGAGGLIAAWSDSRSGHLEIYAQHVGSDGTIMSGWPADGLALCTAGGNDYISYHGGVATVALGGAYVAWTDSRTGAAGQYAQRVHGDGTTAWPANGIPRAPGGTNDSPRLVPDGAGGAIMAWDASRPGSSGLDVYADHFGPDAGALAVLPPVGAGPMALRVLPARPNPARGGTLLRFQIASAGTYALEVLDAAGRLVGVPLPAGAIEAGTHEVRWSGRSAAGGPLPRGLYFVRLSGAGGIATGRIVLN
jgi:hypothetical protein